MRLTSDDVMDMELTTDGTPELVVRGHSGDITIRSTQKSAIHVHVDGFEPNHHVFEGEKLSASQVGNRIILDTHRNPGMLNADLAIEAPVGSSVSVNSIDGDIAIHGTRGPVDVTTVGGDIHLDYAQGTTKITTVDGDVDGEHLDGTLTVQTTNGDVTIGHSTLRRFNVHSMNGDFMIETPLARGEHYFAKTTNGDIRLAIPRDTGATVQMRSVNGEFHSDLPTEVINPSRRHWQGRINGGGANVELETVNGDVHLSETNALDTFAMGTDHSHDMLGEFDSPDRPGEPEPSDLDDDSEVESAPFGSPGLDTMPDKPNYGSPDSIEVLAQLERGEITVEDAMAQLDALR